MNGHTCITNTLRIHLPWNSCTAEDFDSDNEEDNSIPSLRRAANKAKKLETELRFVKRELAFARAGIPMDDPKMGYFVKGYEGEMEADSIRAAAIEAGFISPPQQNQAAPEQTRSFESQQKVMAASAGAIPEDTTEEAAVARMEQAMAEGGIEAMLDVVRQYGIPTSYDS